MIIIIWAWGHRPLIPACGRKRQDYLCEFKDNLVDIDCSRTVRTRPVSNSPKTKQIMILILMLLLLSMYMNISGSELNLIE